MSHSFFFGEQTKPIVDEFFSSLGNLCRETDVEDLNVITALKCNKLPSVITFGLKCNKLLSVITFGFKCNNVIPTSSGTSLTCH